MARGGILAGLGALLLWTTPAHADALTFSVAPSGGATGFDQSLDNYRWDLGPHPTFGLAARAHRGRWSGGLRWTTTATHQATGIPGDSSAPRVRLHAIELIGEARAFRVVGFDFLGAAHAGRLHLGYSPDRLDLDISGQPLQVEYRPVDEWTGGLALGVRRGVTEALSLGLWVDRTAFRLDTAHRNGDEIENRRETFGQWGLRLEAAWKFWP